MYKEPDWLDRQMFVFVERELSEWIFGAGFFFLGLFLAAAATAFGPLFGPTIALPAVTIGGVLLLFLPAITICLVHLTDMISKLKLDKS